MKSGVIIYDETECNASYIELPEDFLFVESAAYNADFDINNFFIPIQRADHKLYVYKANVDDVKVSLKCGPIILKDPKLTDKQKVELTPFGCELDSNGRLWICIFNRNLLIAVDLSSSSNIVTHEVSVHAPNDVTIDKHDKNVLYVVTGQKRGLFTDATAGRVEKLIVRGGCDYTKTEISTRHNTLAGIEVTKDGEIFVSQLYDIFKLSPHDPRTLHTKWYEETIWDGRDGKGRTWLADNISVLGDDGNSFMIPAYTTCNTIVSEHILRSRPMTAIINFTLQLVSAFKNAENLTSALVDPEVDIMFSNNDSRDPLRLIKVSKLNKHQEPIVEHFEVRLNETYTKTNGLRHGRKHFFDANVTAVLSVHHRLICINFQQPRLLLLDVDKFLYCR
jgi:hypothetical protein